MDFEASAEQHRIVVKPSIDEELDEKKRVYDGIDDFLTEVARHIAVTIPEGLPTVVSVIFFPQIGFLIAMPMDPDTRRSLWEGSNNDVWERMFASEAVVYYKNDRMKELDHHFGDIHSDICGMSCPARLIVINRLILLNRSRNWLVQLLNCSLWVNLTD